MKISKTIEVEICDFCKKLEAPADYRCTGCGRVCCDDCDKLTKYRYSTHFSGTHDGYYCEDCEKHLAKTKANPLFNAYLALRQFIANEEYLRIKRNEEALRLEENIERLLDIG